MQGLMSAARPLSPRLPHPRIPLGVLRVIENALSQAWHILLLTQVERGIAVNTALEDEITEELQRILDELRTDPAQPISGFTPNVFETVNREGHYRNYNKQSIDKQPDLIFKLQKLRPGVVHLYDALFVECKPLDKTTNAKAEMNKRYCEDGLIRFINGDYAWAMQDALMVAYVRNTRKFPEDLTQCLQNTSAQASYHTVNLPVRCASYPHSAPNAVYTSIHQRHFVYPQNADKPGNIQVRHLWLRLTPPFHPTDTTNT